MRLGAGDPRGGRRARGSAASRRRCCGSATADVPRADRRDRARRRAWPRRSSSSVRRTASGRGARARRSGSAWSSTRRRRAAWRARSRSGSRRSPRPATSTPRGCGRSITRTSRVETLRAADRRARHARGRAAALSTAAAGIRRWSRARCGRSSRRARTLDGGARDVLARADVVARRRSTIRASCATSIRPPTLQELVMTRAAAVLLALAVAACPGRQVKERPPLADPVAGSDGNVIAAMLAELQDDVLTSYERDEPPEVETRHDPSRDRRRADRRRAGRRADRARARARAEPVAAARRSRSADRGPLEAPRDPPRAGSVRGVGVRRAVVADLDVRPDRRDPAADHDAVRARR